MIFKLKQLQLILLSICALIAINLNAAEWKTEPTIYLKSQYNDNVGVRTEANNPQGSTGFTFEPRVKFVGVEQQNWDVSMDARGKITRYQDIEDADSENIFFKFDSGKQTERSNWRLKATYEDNSTFDTDFDTGNPESGLVDDHTQRKTSSISPIVIWGMSKTSQLSFSINATDVRYEEVTNLNYTDYTKNVAQLGGDWFVAENHQLGFTGSYEETDIPDANYYYDNTVLQIDYTYTINQISDVSLSLGQRKVDSTLTDSTVACEANGFVAPIGEVSSNGECPETIGNIFTGIYPVTPIIDDVSEEDDGIVVDITYSSRSERASHNFVAGRKIIPSSFASAQEQRSAIYQFSFKNTERFTTRLILDASKTETISGALGSSAADRIRYRFEPSINYQLNQNWRLDVVYSYLNVDIDDTSDAAGEDAISNAIYVNLYLNWPRLTTTY